MLDSMEDATRLEEHVRATVPEIFDAPAGWPNNIELALIDAVLSIRSVYGTSADTGDRGAVSRYQRESGRASWNDLSVLGSIDPAWLETVLANRQKTGGVPKAEVITAAAARLAEAGITHAGDVDRDSEAHRNAYCGTRGLGPVTWNYFLMLLGYDGVKPDTLVTRFASEAVGRALSPNEVTALVVAVAEQMNITASSLDHSIWRSMSKARRS